MRDVIRNFLAGSGGDVITAADIANLGCSLDVVQAMVRSKELVNFARGTYIRAAALHPPPDSPLLANKFALVERQHKLRLDALLRRFGKEVAPAIRAPCSPGVFQPGRHPWIVSTSCT